MPITIIDYGASNLKSVSNALKKIGAPYTISDNPAIIKKAKKVILPGVGSAGAAMSELRKKGLIEVIRNLKTLFLGICLGMQLLFEWSEEGQTDCLGIIKGKVKKFDDKKVKVPQVGWNKVNSILNDIPDGAYFYFVHSYYCAPKSQKVIMAATDYGEEFASVVNFKNFWGVQFHPEKSGEIGLKMLKNFLLYDHHSSN